MPSIDKNKKISQADPKSSYSIEQKPAATKERKKESKEQQKCILVASGAEL